MFVIWVVALFILEEVNVSVAPTAVIKVSISFSLMAGSTSEALVNYKTTWCSNPAYSLLLSAV
jgi:hypothetical protein